VRGVLGDLLLIFLFGDEIDTPALVQFGDQVNAFVVVYTVLFPALDKLTLELLSLIREDVRSLLEISTDQLLIDHALRRVAHIFLIIIIAMDGAYNILSEKFREWLRLQRASARSGTKTLGTGKNVTTPS
jgi:hypothetical protein